MPSVSAEVESTCLRSHRRSSRLWSASVHRSFDGRQVLNYVQFESQEAAQRGLAHLARGGHLQRNTALGVVSPGQYEVVYTAGKP